VTGAARAGDELDMNGRENIYSQGPGVIYADIMTTEQDPDDNPQVDGVNHVQPDIIYSELTLNRSKRRNDVSV